ncbi:GDSL-type esterase/lipase family protein [Mangrovibacterium diazotrophicum]|uniref:Lysophospholipase L1-like esterase n=1 Tax=Mangrovibacterium diazotrophicum TaxID=1261403 RepID=A0A419VYJ2_9BACT|nr:GDSL-type esterase/lipase family protein [Mangrovibacterium diazotrophicum]RKD88286.1 lysophospholipase L1-like esterase [Mangrovibacterium diazotrophicum]
MKKSRRINQILLSISLFFIVATVHAQYDPQVKYGKAIDQFEKDDLACPPDTNGILMLGSSSFTKWRDVQDYFPDKNITNRGFGGSQMSDILYFKERLVLPYEPSQVWVFVGGNDMAAGEQPKQVFAEAQQLVNWLKEQYLDIDILFISMKPTPKRWALKKQLLSYNKKLKRYARKTEAVTFVDIWDAMLNADGEPNEELYISDMLHMNAQGYAIWKEALLPYLK